MKTNWALGVVLGILAGGFTLEGGVLALLLLIPALVWAARSRTPSLSLSGLLIGIGIGVIGLIGFANARCVNISGPNFSTSCTPPDLDPYVVASAVFVLLGIGVAAIRIGRARRLP
jgi:hypothetical protein